MKLLGTNEVCEILGISKPTLYRWNNLSDESSQSIESWLTLTNVKSNIESSLKSNIESSLKSNSTISQSIEKALSQTAFKKSFQKNIEEPSPKNFPRPFKIGRAYKWRSDEIDEWLETMRI